MTLYQLYLKCEKSGIDGNPIISNKELKLLSEKLKEVEEFNRYVNTTTIFYNTTISVIEGYLNARKN